MNVPFAPIAPRSNRPLQDKWLKLALGYVFLQSLALLALVYPSQAAESDAGRIERSFPEVRPAEGESELKPTLGVMAGYQNLNGPVNGNVAAAVDAAFQPVIPFSIGLQFQYSPSEVAAGPTDLNFDTTNLLAKGTYNFGGDIPIVKNTYLGAKSGVTWYSGENDTTSHFAIGPTLGMDFMIDEMKKFSLGPELSWLAVLGDNSPDQFSAAGAMKYWF